MKRLIAGVDPGTTAAYALLDLKGNVVDIASSKSFDMNNMISELTKKGKVIVLSADKKNVPNFVRKLSARLGSALIWPKQDLKVREKKELIRDFEIHGDHQRDALASAIFAYSQLRSLFVRIDEELKAQGKERYSEEVKEIMIKNDRLNINAALLMIEPPKKKLPSSRITKTQTLSDKDKRIDNLRLELKYSSDSNRFLKQEKRRLESELKRLKKKLESTENRLFSKKSTRAESTKERRIKALASMNEELEKKLKKEKLKIKRLSALVSSKDHYLLKKMENLGTSEFKRLSKTSPLTKNDILFVDNAFSVSQKVIKELKKRISLIVYNKGPNKNIPFLQISAKDLEKKETDFFVFIQKKDLDKKKNTSKLLQDIIDLHKKGQ